MGKGQVHMHSKGACSQGPPGAPVVTHGREGHMRGKEALGEPECRMRSSRGEALKEREV